MSPTADPPPSTRAHAAGADELTGLAGRSAFFAALGTALDALQAGKAGPPALLLLDLDHFKAVNDSMGHAAGDALLRGVAGRIRANLRTGDVAGRLGGDEFAVLLGPPVDAAEAATVAERLVNLMARPFLIGARVAQIGLSAGIALAAPGTDATSLVRYADLALYAAKGRGRGRHAMFEPALEQAADERHALARDLRAALPLGQFRVMYQPLLDLRRGGLTGAEALLRWERPGHGAVSPLDFLPIAEEIGLMEAIGSWVLLTACEHAVSWPQGGRISVNVAPSQFTAGTLPGLVQAVLLKTGLAPTRLELEVTENALIQRGVEGPMAQFAAISALGVRLAMDDFGTGYSSLSQLRALPFHRVKLDRAFADDLPMIRAALGIGHALGLATTAEGIETDTQLETARREGCEVAQGYLISRPLEAEELSALFHQQTQRAAE